MSPGTVPPPPPIVAFQGVSKIYGQGQGKTVALQEASFQILPGSFTVIVGPSGSGKSTLLNLIGLLDRPTKGTIEVDGRDTAIVTSDADRARLRRDTIGFVFQSFHLLPKATALGNVMMPGVYARLPDRKERAVALLETVGLALRMNHRPSELSGGEQQRVAIARSLVNDPKLLLADEPTGNLDSKTGAEIIRLLRELQKLGKTLVIVTHDDSLTESADQVITVKDGVVR